MWDFQVFLLERDLKMNRKRYIETNVIGIMNDARDRDISPGPFAARSARKCSGPRSRDTIRLLSCTWPVANNPINADSLLMPRPCLAGADGPQAVLLEFC